MWASYIGWTKIYPCRYQNSSTNPKKDRKRKATMKDPKSTKNGEQLKVSNKSGQNSMNSLERYDRKRIRVMILTLLNLFEADQRPTRATDEHNPKTLLERPNAEVYCPESCD